MVEAQHIRTNLLRRIALSGGQLALGALISMGTELLADLGYRPAIMIGLLLFVIACFASVAIMDKWWPDTRESREALRREQVKREQAERELDALRDTDLVSLDEAVTTFPSLEEARKRGSSGDIALMDWAEISFLRVMERLLNAGTISLHGCKGGGYPVRRIPTKYWDDHEINIMSTLSEDGMTTKPNGGPIEPDYYTDLQISRGDLRKLEKVWELRIERERKDALDAPSP